MIAACVPLRISLIIHTDLQQISAYQDIQYKMHIFGAFATGLSCLTNVKSTNL